MKTAILTGFERFGDYTVNPGEVLVRSLDGKVLAGHQIRSMVFPNTVLSTHETVNYGRKIVEEAFSVNASVIISFGLSSQSKGVRIERECFNWIENDKYCSAFESRKPILGTRVPKEKLSMPLQRWHLAALFEKLSAINISCKMSDDPDRYSCNALMYRTLLSMQEFLLETPFIFVHVPCTEEAVANMPDFDRVNKVLFRQELLETVVEELLESYCPLPNTLAE